MLLNGEAGNHGDRRWPVGDVISLGVRLVNSGQSALSELVLRLSAYQDHQNGTFSHRLENKLSVAGSLRAHRDAVRSGPRLAGRHEPFVRSLGALFPSWRQLCRRLKQKTREMNARAMRLTVFSPNDGRALAELWGRGFYLIIK